MRYTLDMNMCRDNQLKILLEKKNGIIIIDDFIVEIFKANNPITMFLKNTKIIKNFPDQIFITHDRGPLVKMEIEKGLPLDADDIIDLDSTTAFRKWLIVENEFNKIVPQAQIEAKNRIDHQKKFVDEYLYNSVRNLIDLFKTENTRKQYLLDKTKLLHHIKEVSTFVMGEFLKDNNIINIDSFKITNSIIYSQNYALLWRIANWSLKNGINSISLDKLSNDGFDIKYVLISSFFDDLLTKEKWLKECRMDIINSVDR